MNKFVIDCSATMSLFLPDENNVDYTSLIYKELENKDCIVPSIWSYEVSNVLLSCKKRNRADEKQINKIANLIYKLPLETENNNFKFIQNNVFNIASSHGLSIYDASYLELAVRFNCSLATLDKKLIDIAKKVNVGLI
jgi:predicted nucleic acid-binding protein|tara:strand:+ start:246 stop:659 length:414 start_codon:yes stop_codon:yes gene_type:complete